jgi:hypothetical protein
MEENKDQADKIDATNTPLLADATNANESKQEENDQHFWLTFFLTEFARESDRAAVILASAMIDESLKELLEAFLVPCSTSEDPIFDGSNAPLSTFSARIESAYRFGLISPSFAKCLHIVRKIRNSFAHDVAGCTFAAPAVSNRVNNLVTATRVHVSKTSAKHAKIGNQRACFCYLIGFFMWRIKQRTKEIEPIEGRNAICCVFAEDQEAVSQDASANA